MILGSRFSRGLADLSGQEENPRLLNSPSFDKMEVLSEVSQQTKVLKQKRKHTDPSSLHDTPPAWEACVKSSLRLSWKLDSMLPRWPQMSRVRESVPSVLEQLFFN